MPTINQLETEIDRLRMLLVASTAECSSLKQAAIVASEEAESGKHLLWNPASITPPSKPMVSRKQAFKVAGVMADKEPGQKFYVCHILEVIESELVRKSSKP